MESRSSFTEVAFDWGDYQPIVRAGIPPYRQSAMSLDLPMKVARQDLAATIEQIPDRIAAVDALKQRNLAADRQTALGGRHYDPLVDLFHQALSLSDPAAGILERPFADLVQDIALLVSNDICVRSGGILRLDVGPPPKRHINYQWIVVMGFRSVSYSKYSVGVDLDLIGYAQRLGQGDDPEPDILEKRADICLADA